MRRSEKTVAGDGKRAPAAHHGERHYWSTPNRCANGQPRPLSTPLVQPQRQLADSATNEMATSPIPGHRRGPVDVPRLACQMGAMVDSDDLVGAAEVAAHPPPVASQQRDDLSAPLCGLPEARRRPAREPGPALATAGHRALAQEEDAVVSHGGDCPRAIRAAGQPPATRLWCRRFKAPRRRSARAPRRRTNGRCWRTTSSARTPSGPADGPSLPARALPAATGLAAVPSARGPLERRPRGSALAGWPVCAGPRPGVPGKRSGDLRE